MLLVVSDPADPQLADRLALQIGQSAGRSSAWSVLWAAIAIVAAETVLGYRLNRAGFLGFGWTFWRFALFQGILIGLAVRTAERLISQLARDGRLDEIVLAGVGARDITGACRRQVVMALEYVLWGVMAFHFLPPLISYMIYGNATSTYSLLPVIVLLPSHVWAIDLGALVGVVFSFAYPRRGALATAAGIAVTGFVAAGWVPLLFFGWLLPHLSQVGAVAGLMLLPFVIAFGYLSGSWRLELTAKLLCGWSTGVAVLILFATWVNRARGSLSVELSTLLALTPMLWALLLPHLTMRTILIDADAVLHHYANNGDGV